MKKRKKFEKKSQFFSLDMIVALAGFLVILVASIWVWDFSREKMYLTEVRADMEFISKNAAVLLVETPGNPSNWENLSDGNVSTTSILAFGLAKSSSVNSLDIEEKGRSMGLDINNYLVLDNDKITRFSNLSSGNYSVQKKLLGVIGSGYEFEVLIRTWNSTQFVTQHRIGRAPPETADNVVRTDRFALLNNTWTNVVFYLWKEEDL